MRISLLESFSRRRRTAWRGDRSQAAGGERFHPPIRPGEFQCARHHHAPSFVHSGPPATSSAARILACLQRPSRQQPPRGPSQPPGATRRQPSRSADCSEDRAMGSWRPTRAASRRRSAHPTCADRRQRRGVSLPPDRAAQSMRVPFGVAVRKWSAAREAHPLLKVVASFERRASINSAIGHVGRLCEVWRKLEHLRVGQDVDDGGEIGIQREAQPFVLCSLSTPPKVIPPFLLTKVEQAREALDGIDAASPQCVRGELALCVCVLLCRPPRRAAVVERRGHACSHS